MSFRYEHYDNTNAWNVTNPFHADDAIPESSMRYSKSSVLAIALTVACSASDLSGVANAQTSNQDFPWRSKSSAKAVVDTVKSKLATPTRDLTTREPIATPTPTFEAMPEVIYDEGKKYVRRGDTYIESSDYAAASTVQQNYSTAASNVTQMPAVKKSSSLFQKTKDLGGRLNPFSKSLRSETAYRASDWKVPSFSQSMSSFSKKDNDPITFAAVTPLPAKSSVPASLDSAPEMLASQNSYKTPNASGLAMPSRGSQFKSALPTETKLTSVFSTDKIESLEKDSKSDSKLDFNPNSFAAAGSSSRKKLPSSFTTKTRSPNTDSLVSSKVSSTLAKDFKPESNSFPKLSSILGETNSSKSLPANSKTTADVEDLSKGFTFTQQIAKTVEAPIETKSASTTSIMPKATSAARKSVTKIAQKVSQDFSPAAEVKSEIRRAVSQIEAKVAKPARPAARMAAHPLSAENEFWTPKR